MISLIIIHLIVFLLPVLYRVSPEAIDPRNALQAPSAAHILGTDESGRDALARLLYGSKVSIEVATFSMFIAVGFGTFIGALRNIFRNA